MENGNSDVEWSLMAWGHGAFQECVMIPFIYQLNDEFENIPKHINKNQFDNTKLNKVVVDQQLFLGLEIIPPTHFAGSLDSFIRTFEKNFDAIELNYQIYNESNEILIGTSFMDITLTNNLGNSSDENIHQQLRLHKYSESTSKGFLIYFDTSWKLASIYWDRPLTVIMTLNVILNQGKPFNQRLVMDQNELNVRLLLDLNRFRPPRIPPRKVEMAVVVNNPLQIITNTREISPYDSLISISISNNHYFNLYDIQGMMINLDETQVDMVRNSNGMLIDGNNFIQNETNSEFDNNDNSIWSNVLKLRFADQIYRVTQLKLSNKPNNCKDENDQKKIISHKNNDNNTNNDSIIIKPNESYTIVYKISIKESIVKNANILLDSKLFGYFISLITFHWRPCIPFKKSLHKINDYFKANESLLHILRTKCSVDNPITIPSVYDLLWSIGKQYCSNNSMTNNFKQSYYNNINNISFIRNNNNNNTQVIDVVMDGPSVCQLNKPFTMQLIITNNNNDAINDVYFMTNNKCNMNLGKERASKKYHPERIDYSLIRNDPISSYLIIESAISIGNLSCGKSQTITLNIIPLVKGPIFIQSLYLVSTSSIESSRIIYQILNPFETTVVNSQ
eukprot:gene4405-6230_t